MTEAPEGPLRPLRAEDVVDLEPLCTRLDRCVSVMPGPVDPDVLSVLAEPTRLRVLNCVAAAPLLFQIIDTLRASWPESVTPHLPPPGANLKRVEFCALSGDLPNEHCARPWR